MDKTEQPETKSYMLELLLRMFYAPYFVAGWSAIAFEEAGL